MENESSCYYLNKQVDTLNEIDGRYINAHAYKLVKLHPKLFYVQTLGYYGLLVNEDKLEATIATYKRMHPNWVEQNPPKSFFAHTIIM